MDWCTRVYHPSALFICEVYTRLLANEQKLFFTCSHGWSALFFFDIVRRTFIFLKTSTVPLEVSGFSIVKACEFPLDLDLVCALSLFFGLLCLLLPLPDYCATYASNWGRTPLSFLLVSSFRILVFTNCEDKFSSWHEVLRDTSRFSQLSAEYVAVASLA